MYTHTHTTRTSLPYAQTHAGDEIHPVLKTEPETVKMFPQTQVNILCDLINHPRLTACGHCRYMHTVKHTCWQLVDQEDVLNEDFHA